MDTVIEKRSWKKIATFQRVLSIILAVFLLAASMGELFYVPFNEQYDTYFETIYSEEEPIPNERKVSISFLSSVLSVYHIFSLASLKTFDFYESYNAILQTENSISTDAQSLALMLVDSYDNSFTFTVYLAMLMLSSIFMPFFLLAVLIKLIKNYSFPSIYKKQYYLYKGAMNQFSSVIYKMSFLLILCVIAPKTVFGNAMVILVGICGVEILVHFISAWLKDYTASQRKYLAILQVMSLINLLIGILFAFAVCKCNLAHHITDRIFSNITLADIFAIFYEGHFTFDGERLYFFLGFLFFGALLYTYRVLGNNLCRIAMVPNRENPKKASKEGTHIISALFPNTMILIYWLFKTSREEIAFLDNEIKYFVLAMACVAAITLVEIITWILCVVVCVDLGEGGKDAVLEGCTYAAKMEKQEADEVKKYEKRHKKF